MQQFIEKSEAKNLLVHLIFADLEEAYDSSSLQKIFWNIEKHWFKWNVCSSILPLWIFRFQHLQRSILLISRFEWSFITVSICCFYLKGSPLRAFILFASHNSMVLGLLFISIFFTYPSYLNCLLSRFFVIKDVISIFHHTLSILQ